MPAKRVVFSVLLLLGTTVALMGCGRSGPETHPDHKAVSSMSSRPIEDVLKDHTPTLMAIPGVVGTAEGAEDGRPSILVFLARDTPEIRGAIPDEIEGYPVKIQVTGEITPLRRND